MNKNNPSNHVYKTPQNNKPIQTKIIDDVFTDAVEMVRPKFEVDYEAYLNRLWEVNPEIYKLLKKAHDLENARDKLYSFLEKAERKIFEKDNDFHILEKATVRECIRAFKSVIGPINEYRTEFSALECLWKLANNKNKKLTQEISVGFLEEFINLFRGVSGKSNIYFDSTEAKKGIPDFLKMV